MALKSPRLRALALGMKGEVLRTVQLGLRRKAKEGSRFTHPGIVKATDYHGNM